MEHAFDRILLVDDEDDHHFITKLALRKAGYTGTFTGVYSADDAIACMRAGEDPPDLILVDINMPGTNGFELLYQCEQEGLLPNDRTMVVMCSSSSRPMDIEAARRFRSVDDYIEKAFTVEQFERLRAANRRKHA